MEVIVRTCATVIRTMMSATTAAKAPSTRIVASATTALTVDRAILRSRCGADVQTPTAMQTWAKDGTSSALRTGCGTHASTRNVMQSGRVSLTQVCGIARVQSIFVMTKQIRTAQAPVVPVLPSPDAIPAVHSRCRHGCRPRSGERCRIADVAGTMERHACSWIVYLVGSDCFHTFSQHALEWACPVARTRRREHECMQHVRPAYSRVWVGCSHVRRFSPGHDVHLLCFGPMMGMAPRRER
mmetsp:Transcript_18506/g.42450  ORF Transcript_18506/g.42450 Transcript_18506/m.42450 type:complete len:241 (-) Transcript_18506:192-914(-)